MDCVMERESSLFKICMWSALILAVCLVAAAEYNLMLERSTPPIKQFPSHLDEPFDHPNAAAGNLHVDDFVLAF